MLELAERPPVAELEITELLQVIDANLARRSSDTVAQEQQRKSGETTTQTKRQRKEQAQDKLSNARAKMRTPVMSAIYSMHAPNEP